MNCNKPDIDVPRLECGHSLPCPYHTVTLERGQVLAPKGMILTRGQYKKLKPIATVCQGHEHE